MSDVASEAAVEKVLETPLIEKAKPAEEDILEAMKDVVDPELGINVVDLGLVYGVHIDEGDDGSVVISDVSYDSMGCSISQASVSVMTDLVVGKSLAEATTAYDAFLALMRTKGDTDSVIEREEEVLEDAVAFEGVSKYPARIKCALLGWMAWKDATARAVDSSTTTEETA